MVSVQAVFNSPSIPGDARLTFETMALLKLSMLPYVPVGKGGLIQRPKLDIYLYML